MKRLIIGLLATVLLTFFVSSTSHANLILTLDEGGTQATDVIVADNQPAGVSTIYGLTTSADSSGILGQISFNGSAGSWSTNITTGLSKPTISAPLLDLNSINVSGSNSGQLNITLVDDSFTTPSNGFITTLGGTTDSRTFSLLSYYDASNFVPSLTLLSSFNYLGPGAFLATESIPVSEISSYSLRLRAIIDSTEANQTTSFDASIGLASNPVPEPATMLLLGTGLVGVAGAARRRKKGQA